MIEFLSSKKETIGTFCPYLSQVNKTNLVKIIHITDKMKPEYRKTPQ